MSAQQTTFNALLACAHAVPSLMRLENETRKLREDSPELHGLAEELLCKARNLSDLLEAKGGES